jgi:very-short-patch-repair endonuclease
VANRSRKFQNLANKVKPWKKALAKKYAKNLTGPERLLWKRLKDKQLGVWFYKQKVLLGYIADFWCPAAGLVIEVDGPFHAKRKAYDRRRDQAMAAKGILTVRFKTGEVQKNLNAVVSLIRNKVAER